METGRRLLCYCLLYGEYYLCIFIRLRRILFGELFWKKIKKYLQSPYIDAKIKCERAMSASITADSSLNYERRISSESKIICKADLREMQDH